MSSAAKHGQSRPRATVTGMGIVSSLGHDVTAFGKALMAGQSGIRHIDRETRPPLAVPIGAEIAGFALPVALANIAGLPTAIAERALQSARRAPFPIQASVIAALEAWMQAGLHERQCPPERIGLVIAGHNTTSAYQYAALADFQAQPDYLSPRYALHALDSDHLGVLGRILDIQGEGFVTGAASASGNIAIIQGMRLIEAGVVDCCLVVGVAAELSPMDIQGFHHIGAMGGKRFRDLPAQACRPFDTDHEGFIYGQAAAAILLEAPHRNPAGTPALAGLLGGAINLHASAGSEPNQAGEVRAMREALAQSGLDPAAIAYLNTHGSSSPLGDTVEIAAIAETFGDHFPSLWLNATKGLTGHCLHAAGVVELIASIVQMQGGFLHPNLNLHRPIRADARLCGAEAVSVRIEHAMSNSFGFGGINTSIVLRQGEEIDGAEAR
jgi:malonyl-ACP decarboxylase